MSKFVFAIGLFAVSAIMMIGSSVEGAFDMKTEFVSFLTELQTKVGDTEGVALQEFNTCYIGSPKHEFILASCGVRAARSIENKVLNKMKESTRKKEEILRIFQDYVDKVSVDYFQTKVPMGGYVIDWMFKNGGHPGVTFDPNVVYVERNHGQK